MLKRMAVIAMLAAGPAAATQEYILPTLFDVTGVAADDVLNIRETPSASAEIIGNLRPDQTRVEVLALDSSGQWGQLNAGERTGWVSMRFLAYRSDVWEAGRLPADLSCVGTEPFWSYHLEGDSLIWSEPGQDATFAAPQVMDSGYARDPRRAIYYQDENDVFSATITPAQCSDNMSAIVYGLETLVIRQNGNQPPRMYSGCCSIGR